MTLVQSLVTSRLNYCDSLVFCSLCLACLSPPGNAASYFLLFSVTQSKKDLQCSDLLPPYPGLSHWFPGINFSPRQILLLIVPESTSSFVSFCPFCAVLFTWDALVLYTSPKSTHSFKPHFMSFFSTETSLIVIVHVDVSFSHTLILSDYWNHKLFEGTVL